MDSRVFIIGRDPVPQYVRLAPGERLNWTLVYLPEHSGGAAGTAVNAVGFADPTASGPPSYVAVIIPGAPGGSSPLKPAGEKRASARTAESGTEQRSCDVGSSGAAGGVMGAEPPSIIPLEIDIDGEGCEVDIAGMYICSGDEDVRFNINVRHNSGGSVSRQLFKGIVGGRSRAEFDGLIYVKRDAQQTKAYQENHNILLTDTARVETRPQLEIYADDVECSHGATTGYLNPDEQFYMRSRGIPEAEARRLQMISFLAPVLDRLPEELREEAVSMI